VQALKKRGFVFEEWILSPTQFGVPNNRPRYYLIAKRVHLKEREEELKGDNLTEIIPLNLKKEWPESFEPLPVSFFLDDHREPPQDEDQEEDLKIPSSFFKSRKFIAPSSIVHPSSLSTSCFTKAYGHHGLRSGGFLQTQGLDLEITQELLNEPERAQAELGLRMFSPQE
jgi:tRNA (cytosine38-C5)-methyltransferase